LGVLCRNSSGPAKPLPARWASILRKFAGPYQITAAFTRLEKPAFPSPGSSKDFRVHQELCKAQKLALENIANLDKIPESGALLYVIPMFIKNGTGAPARVFAELP